MISKDQLARFVRFLNQNYLASNKIRYFSTKRKNQILKELKEIYNIEAAGVVIHFIGKNKSLIDTKYMVDTKRWFIGGKWISLPRSKPNLPSIKFKKGPSTFSQRGNISSRFFSRLSFFRVPFVKSRIILVER